MPSFRCIGSDASQIWCARRKQEHLPGEVVCECNEASVPFEGSGRSPVVLDVEAGERFRHYTLRVPQNLRYLDGHFPGFPVVPAVAQLQWAMDGARDLLDREPILYAIEALKFTGLLRPDQVFDLRVDLALSGDAVTFRLWHGNQVYSSGRCLLTDEHT